MKRRTFLATPVLAAPVVWSTVLRAAGRVPNIVLIVAGNWRAQSVPWAGDVNLSAPNLARFGRESLLLARAYSSAPKTDPARTALATSRFPHASFPEAPRLATLMSAAGYRTRAFNGGDAGDMVSFAHAPAPKPFFIEWFLDVPSSLMERIPSANLQLRENVPEAERAEALDSLAAFYARCTARDHDLGIVLGALDRPGLFDDTIVVFTSDHGDMLGSHGLIGSNGPYEESVRVPLAIRHPRALTSGAADILVSLVDLAPTLLAFAGIPAPQGMQGRDLSALLGGRKSEIPEAVYAEGRLGESDEWRMLVHGYDKLVTDREGKVTHLYNLADDPLERSNLATVMANELKRDALLAQQKEWARRLGDGVDASGLKQR